MTDYISRQAAIEAVDECTKLKITDDFYTVYTEEMKDVIADIPAADVVEVVRCKDCKHKPNGYTDDDVLRYPNFPHEESNPCPCQVHEDEWYSWIPNDDFYCSYGERAEA